MLTRKIGKFLRGKTTPFQVISATVLGALLATVPGFGQAPLLLGLLFFSLVMLNANLYISGLSFVLAKGVYWAALPFYFGAGIWLAEGPLKGLLTALVNAPVLAWFGLEYYVAVPALLGHGLLGLVGGVAISRSLVAFRRKMATLERGSEAYQHFVGRRSVQLVAWLILGGLEGPESWESLSERKGPGLLIRPLGIALVLALSVLGYVGVKLLDERIVTQYAREALERVNGATVDLEAVTIDPGLGRVTLRGLALADPSAPDLNRFAADTLVADLSGLSLLSRKAVVDRIEVTGARIGETRRFPGVLIRPPLQTEVPERDRIDLPIEAYLQDAGKWRDRLDALKRAYDQLAPYLKKAAGPEESPDRGALNWREQLAERARQSGYAGVAAETLIAGSPRFLVRLLEVNPIRMEGQAQSFALEGHNLSSHPALLAERGRLRLVRSDGQMEVQLALPSAEYPATSALSLEQRQISVDALRAETGGKLPCSGGTLDLRGEGKITGGVLDLPLKIDFRDTAVTVAGRSVSLREASLEVRIYGPLDRPRLALPKEALKALLKESGKQQLEQVIEEKAGESLRKWLPSGRGQ